MLEKTTKLRRLEATVATTALLLWWGITPKEAGTPKEVTHSFPQLQSSGQVLISGMDRPLSRES